MIEKIKEKHMKWKTCGRKQMGSEARKGKIGENMTGETCERKHVCVGMEGLV